MFFEYRICPKCGCRMAGLNGADVSQHCRRCDGPPPIYAYQVNVMFTADGKHWRVEVIDPKGEIVFREECPNRELARARADFIAKDVAEFCARPTP